jgi:DNA helicase HerA-like ATPase
VRGQDVANAFYLPKPSQHLAIIGRNGSGKTQAALWHLSKRNFDVMPFVAFDFKGDELINSIDRARHIELRELPRRAGIYIIHPTPQDIDDGAVDSFLWKMYERGSIGGWIDESYMLQRSRAFETLLVQGRSKRIPLTVLTQRPVWVSRYIFSESAFFQVFSLNDKRDRQTVEAIVPVNLDARLDDFHSYYYDVLRDKLVIMQPVPTADEILGRIDERLHKVRGKL